MLNDNQDEVVRRQRNKRAVLRLMWWGRTWNRDGAEWHRATGWVSALEGTESRKPPRWKRGVAAAKRSWFCGPVTPGRRRPRTSLYPHASSPRHSWHRASSTDPARTLDTAMASLPCAPAFIRAPRRSESSSTRLSCHSGPRPMSRSTHSRISIRTSTGRLSRSTTIRASVGCDAARPPPSAKRRVPCPHARWPPSATIGSSRNAAASSWSL